MTSATQLAGSTTVDLCDTYSIRFVSILGIPYHVSFIPLIQTIVYTSMEDVRDQGEFTVKFGHICSKKLNDVVLINEIINHKEGLKNA
jgi:hypothetical protein